MCSNYSDSGGYASCLLARLRILSRSLTNMQTQIPSHATSAKTVPTWAAFLCQTLCQKECRPTSGLAAMWSLPRAPVWAEWH
jgi:hypothetical protein